MPPKAPPKVPPKAPPKAPPKDRPAAPKDLPGLTATEIDLFYDAPPPHGVGIEGRAWPNQFLGPVHSSVASPMFTTVLVPHPELPMLVWMNVWSYIAGYGVNYAYQVSPLVLQAWLNTGWRNRFMD